MVTNEDGNFTGLDSFAGIRLRRSEDTTPYGVCALIYGQAGVGKTTLVAGAQASPYGSPVVIVDADAGSRSITHINGITIADVRTYAEVLQFTNKLAESCPWKTVVIDNLSEVQSMMLKHIKPDGLPDIKDYQKLSAEMLRLVRYYRDLARSKAVNVFFIAWDKGDRDEGSGIFKYGLHLSPSVAATIPGILDIIGYMYIEPLKDVRVLSFAPSMKNVAKFRRSQTEHAAKMPLVIANPNIGDVLATLVGGEPWVTK